MLQFKITNALVLALAIASCSQKNPNSAQIKQNTQVVPTQNSDISPKDKNELRRIGETATDNPYLIKLNKSFWLGKKLWVSMGVERSSVTGLALNVIGYIPAELEQVGSQLVLKRQNKGQFGGSTLAPEIALNAYPILFESETEILVDLSQPQTGYGLALLGAMTSSETNSEIETRLAYVKSIELGEDRVSFETVLSGKSPVRMFEPGDGSVESLTGQDPYSLAINLRQDWILESPQPTFKPVPASSARIGFFLENPYVNNSNSGVELKQYASVIDENKPFVWTISHNTPAEYLDAVKQGVLAWNKTLQKEFLQVQVAKGPQSFTDPRTSNLVWDDNLAVGTAFANWRANPYTGQILQGQIYMSGKMWAESAKRLYRLRRLEQSIRKAYSKQSLNPLPPGTELKKVEVTDAQKMEFKKQLDQLKIAAQNQQSRTGHFESSKIKRFNMGYNSAHALDEAQKTHHCFRTTEHLEFQLGALNQLEQFLNSDSENADFPEIAYSSVLPPEFHNPYPESSLSEKQFAENVVRAVVIHEVGHTLGLRHNFMGSTQTTDGGRIQSASIMDYNDLVIDAQFDQPGDADAWILSQAYSVKNRNSLKPHRFCSDEGAQMRVLNCTLDDFGPSSITSFATQAESYLLMAHYYYKVGHPSALNYIIQALREIMPMTRDMLLPTSMGDAVGMAELAEAQKLAWNFLKNTQNFMGLDFGQLKPAVIRDAGLSILMSQVSKHSSHSVVFPETLTEIKDVVLNKESQFALGLRAMAVESLVNAQNIDARNVIATAEKELAPVADTQVDNLELLIRVRKVLENGYFRPDIN